MAVRRQPVAQGAQQVFKPKDQVVKFGKVFPFLYAGFGVVLLAALGLGWHFNNWLIPIMVAFPVSSIFMTGAYVNKMANGRVVIDQERLRMLEGNQVKSNLTWRQITRLTIRRERDADLYELWVKNQAIHLPAAFYQEGDKLLQAISARTNLAWERVKK